MQHRHVARSSDMRSVRPSSLTYLPSFSIRQSPVAFALRQRFGVQMHGAERRFLSHLIALISPQQQEHLYGA